MSRTDDRPREPHASPGVAGWSFTRWMFVIAGVLLVLFVLFSVLAWAYVQ